MILENGVIRTMDPALPTARALAIAGDRVAGGVGTHETALPSPDVVDLGGRCVVARLHGLARPLPDVVALPARREARGRLRPRGGARRACARIRGTARGSAGPAGARRSGTQQPTAAALDAVTGDVPALLFSKDYHSAWLNSAALARADGDLQVDGGVVERDASGAPTGILREESAWQFRARCRDAARGRVRRRHPRGSPHRREPRRRRDPRQGRVARRAAHLPADSRARRAHAPRVAVRPVRAPARARGADGALAESATTSSASGT